MSANRSFDSNNVILGMLIVGFCIVMFSCTFHTIFSNILFIFGFVLIIGGILAEIVYTGMKPNEEITIEEWE